MIRGLSPDLAKIANEELNEKPSQINDDIQHLKEWILKQPHLRARTDDQWLVAILRVSKFSLEKAKQKLDLYYTLRTTAPDITARIRPTDPKFIEFFRLGTCTILPKPKDKLFPRVFLIRPGAFDPNTHNVADLVCMFYYLVQILIVEDDVATVLGVKVMVDYENVTMAHLAQGTPTMLKKMMAVFQDSMPLRSKGSHHVNLPSGIDIIFSLLSPFTKEKAKERIKIHKSCEELTDFIPREIIPKEYGGAGESVANITEYWALKFKEYNSWMQQEEQFGTDENKRIGQLINTDVLGVDGSFRQLDID